MILPIYLYGNSTLRKKSENITKDYPGLQELIINMFETMYKAEGVGLAAPQIGKNINVIVIDGSCIKNEDEPELENFKRIFINPKFTINSENKRNSEEGCLSIPDIHENVLRYTDITVEYFNEDFEQITERLTLTQAKIFQHEYDHLQGIVFTDKINPLRKQMLNFRLNSISKGKSKTNYKTKTL
ncbi:MAG: peptide deformylase [Bacteroidales bacterium]|jgi:peptide deformylase|nr:peptide deformylase [Bacteroidales bacterium]